MVWWLKIAFPNLFILFLSTGKCAALSSDLTVIWIHTGGFLRTWCKIHLIFCPLSFMNVLSFFKKKKKRLLRVLYVTNRTFSHKKNLFYVTPLESSEPFQPYFKECVSWNGCHYILEFDLYIDNTVRWRV